MEKKKKRAVWFLTTILVAVALVAYFALGLTFATLVVIACVIAMSVLALTINVLGQATDPRVF